jgi:hypothetical protein
VIGPSSSDNLLLAPVEYKVTETSRGTWRRYLYPNGRLYADYTSHTELLGLPLVRYTRGISPETGTAVTARGFIAIGRRAVGVIAIGRLAAGVVAIGHASVGVVALGQAALGLVAVGQLALGAAFGLGQVVTGVVCIGQVAFGKWVLAQVGFGQHVWSMRVRDPAAIAFFRSLVGRP